MATNDKSSEEQLKEQLEQICIDYKQLIDKSKNMPPKDSKNVDPKADANIDEDIEEIANVSENLDSLASALDLIEERADRIREQLLELLSSNREIRESIRQENATQENVTNEHDGTTSDDTCRNSDTPNN